MAINPERNAENLGLIALLDERGRLLYSSPLLEKAFGCEAKAIPSTSLFDLIHPDDRKRVMEAFNRGIEDPGAVQYTEFRLRHKDGSWHFYESSGNGLLQQSEIRGVVISLHDTTDGKQAERERSRKEGYFQTVMDNSMDIIAVMEGSGRLTYINPAVKRVLGYDPEELIGESCLKFIQLEDREFTQSILDMASQDKEYPTRIEFRALHKDKSFRYLEGIGKKYKDDIIDGIIVNLRDVSYRKKKEEELSDRNEELEALAYTISHDLLTPVAVVEGYAKTALEADAKGRAEAERECLQSIIQATQRMSRIIDSLLQYARAGRIDTEIEIIGSDEALGEALMTLQEIIERKQVKIKIPGSMPSLPVDYIKLYQVFLNLIENAIKHGNSVPDLEIEIGVREESDRALFYVKDNGPGIPTKFQKDIFEPFRHFSVSGSTGLGIGLSTVERAVTSWGGKLWVNSGKGRGATFFFSGPGPTRE